MSEICTVKKVNDSDGIRNHEHRLKQDIWNNARQVLNERVF